MGRQRRSRTHHARKHIKKQFRTHQIHEDLDPQKYQQLKTQDIEADLPGLAQHYCVECCRYFVDDISLSVHTKSKVHKRRLKQLKEEVYTQKSAELAVGLVTENSRPFVPTVSTGAESMLDLMF